MAVKIAITLRHDVTNSLNRLYPILFSQYFIICLLRIKSGQSFFFIGESSAPLSGGQLLQFWRHLLCHFFNLLCEISLGVEIILQ